MTESLDTSEADAVAPTPGSVLLGECLGPYNLAASGPICGDIAFFAGTGGEILRITSDGRIIASATARPDEAAIQLLECLRKIIPGWLAKPTPALEAPQALTDERAMFEAALSAKDGAPLYWNAADAMFWAWQARALLAAQPAMPSMSNKMALDALTNVLSDLEIGAHPHLHIDEIRAAIAALQAEPQPANEREAALWRMVTANPQRAANLLSSWCDDGEATIEELEAAMAKD